LKPFPLHYAAIGLFITALASASTLSGLDALPSTYMAVVGLMLGVVSVILMSWRNALPTDTVGQLLQRTEANERPGRTRAREMGIDRR
jgi:hypothetical protein